ncbi:MAG: hypothetical protein Q7R30_14785 [Acidobacteriota bacterium]|nr:hypothetical protein [Acidobacteriota bacterium]
MDRPSSAEYLVLRQTIASRSSLRAVLLLTGLGIWAVLLIAVLAFLPYPLAVAVPLVVLAATFEAIRPLHFGAERIGRYLQVFYEEQGQPGRSLSDVPSWERVAMSLGSVPGAGGHPLFVPLFFIATIVNYLPVLLARPAALPVELGTIAVPHIAFVVWLLYSDRAMRTQRTVELARFRELRDAPQITQKN